MKYRGSNETNAQERAMPMEIRIEDEDACALAAELAALTGESLTFAVASALREQLAREMERKARQDRIMAITRDIARGMPLAA